MGLTDEELDRDWQPNGRRPQSYVRTCLSLCPGHASSPRAGTIARSFSQELMDIFKIENSIADLDEQVEKRKQQVTTQTSELESLEARIREMEERLKRSKDGVAAAGGSSLLGQGAATGTQKEAAKTSRPGTAKQSQQQAPARGGAMPPTPTASEGE
ncbi:hypothetical protein DL764_002239 [Monosporascus ibericus]|uniref:Uncharacterized protein n=1 Tax=Monosporascus ibericus TaxID=155417 RepID=A0A4Q4TQY7_9PEZI|nr:hypothetical protein DL764_002239 [Monosporascus ibericus]